MNLAGLGIAEGIADISSFIIEIKSVFVVGITEQIFVHFGDSTDIEGIIAFGA